MMNDTKARLEISLDIAANAKVYARKVFENPTPEDELIIRNAMMHGANIALERVTKNERKTKKQIKRSSNVIQFSPKNGWNNGLI
jgi:hypothetical protein